ncbi:MAG: type II toxin-antitoxin system RatA family toxin [Gammaproteobacteria bacterium]|nr:type II toxin-antitoxin system RatA family toxin [Gammaproteobacteria bacterium]MDH4314560.1 type II toxin-antitoxin system RatA family toxin [Gammaproteobacteria bacterium]MDH5213755.1 type II toxin-antitoxin system RatA family toxin [Gammaproteobacteria bacterium]MDH5499618.1 type II toxin-antitoxin system RatA family toxin [Gammaproteobacteria bacterium]
MRRVSRSALVPYSAREMFVLVDDVEAYPDFLPWCNDAEVHKRTDDVVEATLELHKGSVSNHFTTRNRRREFESIGIELIGGPFRQLAGGWKFANLGDKGSKVALELEFEFSSLIVDMMFGAFFEDTCNSLVDAFTKRAAEVFGPRKA